MTQALHVVPEPSAQEIFENWTIDGFLSPGGPPWRLRKVHKITPLTSRTFRSRISHHIRIPGRIFDDALSALAEMIKEKGVHSPLARSLEQLPATYDATAQQVIPREKALPTILPLALMRKALLLDFSIEVEGHGVGVLIPRHRACRLTQRRIGRRLTAGPDAVNGYERIHFDHMPLVEALVYSGPGLDRAQLNLTPDASPNDIAQAAVGWMQNSLLPYFDSFAELKRVLGRNIIRNLLEDTVKKGNAIAGRLGDEEALEILGPQTVTVRSPFLLVSAFFELASMGNFDYIRLPHPDGGAGSQDLLDRALVMADSLIASLLELGVRDREGLARVLFELRILSEYFIAYVPVRVPAATDFLVKLENTEELSSPAWSSRGRRLLFPGILDIPIVIGDALSNHFEIACLTPTEMIQKPERTAVLIGDHVVPRRIVFPGQEHMTPYLQHLYTSKGVHELRRILTALPDMGDRGRQDENWFVRSYRSLRGWFLVEERQPQRPSVGRPSIPEFRRLVDAWNESRVDARLRIYVGVGSSIQWIGGFTISFLVVTVAAFFASFDPYTRQLTLLDTLPWLFPGTAAGISLITLMLRVRVQEPIIHEWVRNRVLLILGAAAFLGAYTLFGFVFPGPISSFRRVVLTPVCWVVAQDTAIWRSLDCKSVLQPPQELRGERLRSSPRPL